MSASASSSSKRQKKESVEIAHMHVLSNNPKTVKSQSTTMSATIQTPSMKMESNDSELSTDLLLIKKESLRKKLIAFGSFDSNSSSLCCDSLMGSASEPVNLSAQSPRGSTDKGLTKPGKLFQWDYLLKEMVSCMYMIIIALFELLYHNLNSNGWRAMFKKSVNDTSAMLRNSFVPSNLMQKQGKLKSLRKQR